MSAPPAARPRPSIAESVAALRAVGKSSHGAPLYSRVVNRPAGRYLAALAHRAGLTPDQVTGVSALLTLAGIVLVAVLPPDPLLGPVVAGLLALGYALDSSDGQLARLRGGGTLTGEWLDHVVDCAKNAGIHLAVLVSFHRFGPADPAALAVPAAFQLVVTVMFFGTVLTDQLRRSRGAGPQRAEPGRSSLVRSLLVAPADYGLLCVAFVCFGVRPAFLAVYVLLLAGSAAYLAAGLVRWRRQLAALDAVA